MSGALRSVFQTQEMLTNGQAGRTTPDVSPHWLGLAVDIGSFTTEGGHMVTLKDDLRETKNGEVKYKKGQKLPNTGFGEKTREIYSLMIGRALFSMVDPLRANKGFEIAPLWERTQKNWHVVIRPNVD